MNALLLLAHSIEEHDQLKLLTELGYTVASIGGYIDPRHPHDPKRPALDIDKVDTVWDAVQAVPATEDAPDRLWNAKDDLPDAIVEWADTVIVHHVEWRWIVNNWDKLRDKRVIWRTVGQSSHENEARMKRYRDDGLQVVRYSPKEQNLPNYIGEDALIRFWKDPDEWTGWTGEVDYVTNFTQSLLERAGFCNARFFLDATSDLPTMPGGMGSEQLPGGLGEVSLETMQTALRHCRAYLYTGTIPASYTLGFIEASMTGIPVISIGPEAFGGQTHLPYVRDLFEAHEFAWDWSDDPAIARERLNRLLGDTEEAADASAWTRQRAKETFGKDVVGAAWKEFLG